MDRIKGPKEGDLYATVSVGGHTFDIRYGYYEESDRTLCEPVVVYPDLKNKPVFSPEGYRLVTAVQGPCEHYAVTDGHEPEECCSDCMYYPNAKEEIGVCRCKHNKRMIPFANATKKEVFV